MLTGKSLIAGAPVDSAEGCFTAGGALAEFEEASEAHVDRAVGAAERAAREYRRSLPAQRAAFLDRIAEEIERSADLLDAAHAETALPPERLAGERARTTGQLRLFANVVAKARGWTPASIARCRTARRSRNQTSAGC